MTFTKMQMSEFRHIKMKLRYISLFSGIEAATVAWSQLGWECVAVAEIEKFPCAVLKHHYPNVPNLGDINKITQKQIEALGPIDIVVGGFPCQDLSIAGKRKGLKHADGTHTRSGLFFKAEQIANWSGARFTLVENVPGIFSSNEGRDFASVVGELAGNKFDVPGDGWRTSGFALGPKGLVEWAVLDAQYFNLAQRRERVFIIRDSGNWQDRPPLLLDRESLCGNPAPRREARKKAAADASTGIGGSGEHTASLDQEMNGREKDEAVGALLKGSPTGGGATNASNQSAPKSQRLTRKTKLIGVTVSTLKG